MYRPSENQTERIGRRPGNCHRLSRGDGRSTDGDGSAIVREGPNQFLLPGVFGLSELLCPLRSSEESLVGLDRRLGRSDRLAQFSRGDSRVQW